MGGFLERTTGRVRSLGAVLKVLEIQPERRVRRRSGGEGSVMTIGLSVMPLLSIFSLTRCPPIGSFGRTTHPRDNQGDGRMKRRNILDSFTVRWGCGGTGRTFSPYMIGGSIYREDNQELSPSDARHETERTYWGSGLDDRFVLPPGFQWYHV